MASGVKLLRCMFECIFVITSVMLCLILVVVGAASQPADPHLSAAFVSSHVPPRYPVSCRPAENHAANTS